jgi:flagellar motility protein MotE (MotC chaperone)
MAVTTKLERESLEAHVDLCSERYKMMEKQLEEMKKDFKEDRKVIHERIDKVKDSIVDMRDYIMRGQIHQNKVIVSSAVAIIVALIGSIVMMIH